MSLTSETESVQSNDMKRASGKRKALINHAVRVDAQMLQQAYTIGLNVGDVFRKALADEILRVSGICPMCGSKRKKK